QEQSPGALGRTAGTMCQVRAGTLLESIPDRSGLRAMCASGEGGPVNPKGWILVRAFLGSVGVTFLYAAFLGHHELYAPSWRAAGVLLLAITGAVLFHEAIR